MGWVNMQAISLALACSQDHVHLGAGSHGADEAARAMVIAAGIGMPRPAGLTRPESRSMHWQVTAASSGLVSTRFACVHQQVCRPKVRRWAGRSSSAVDKATSGF